MGCRTRLNNFVKKSSTLCRIPGGQSARPSVNSIWRMLFCSKNSMHGPVAAPEGDVCKGGLEEEEEEEEEDLKLFEDEEDDAD